MKDLSKRKMGRKVTKKVAVTAVGLTLAAVSAVPVGAMIASDTVLAAENTVGGDNIYSNENVMNVTAPLARPRVYIESFVGDITSKNDERYTSITYVDKDGNTDSYPVRVKVQGNSSLAYYKKNYNLTFYKDDTYAKKNKISTQLGKQNKWTLKANWIDKTHSRNIVTARLAADLNARYGVFDNTINHGVIDGYPVEVYNDGQFWGIYTWNIAKGKWLWGVDDSIPGQVVIGADNWTWATAMAEEINDFDTASGWEVEEGNYDADTVAGFNRLVRFINDSSDEDFKAHFSEYMDKDAAINYLLMLHLTNAIDNTNKNIILVTYDNGKVWTPALYDLDVTFGTYWNGAKMRYNFNPETESDYDSTHPQMVNKLWGRMTKNFGAEISDRYFALRNDLFSYDSIINRFTEFSASVGDDGYSMDHLKWSDQPGYGIDQIAEYLQFKLPYLDDYMANVSANSEPAPEPGHFPEPEPEPVKQGFVNENGAVYYYENGAKVYGQKQIGNDWYMFDLSTGRMATGWYQHTAETEPEGPKTVYYDAQGRMLKGNQKIDGKDYYFDPGTGAMRSGFVNENGGVYYYENGLKVYGQKQIGNDWYMFDLSTGKMATGWYQHTAETEPQGPKTVYYDEQGRMLKGNQNIDGKDYYFDPGTGAMRSGFVNENGAVYYYENGSKVYGQKQIGNDWYMFDLSTGKMVTGWYQHTKQTEPSGAKKVYYDAQGRMLKGYQKIDRYYYYLDPGTGAMRTGFIRVNGRLLYFGTSGRQGYLF